MLGERIAALATVAALGAGLVPLASAQDLGVRALGARGGVSMNPDQFHFGVHAYAGTFTRRVRFQPSFELGLGNGVRVAAVNADALYLFRARPWRPYAGGGLGINFIDVTRGVGEGRGLDIEPALNLVGGIEWGAVPRGSRAPRRYLLEARLGLGDTPDFKLTAGVAF